MSAPVDVLAVMQYAANETEAMIWRAQNPKIPGVSEPGDGFRLDEIVHRDTQDALAGLIEARAAVAELIEADKAYDAALAADASAEADGDDDLICNAGRQLQWAKDRRANALARVGGAA